MSTPLIERALFQKFTAQHTIYVAIKDNEVKGRLIIRYHQNSGNESVDWTDYTMRANDATGTAFTADRAMKGMKFGDNEFSGDSNPMNQMKAWGYKVSMVLC